VLILNNREQALVISFGEVSLGWDIDYRIVGVKRRAGPSVSDEAFLFPDCAWGISVSGIVN